MVKRIGQSGKSVPNRHTPEVEPAPLSSHNPLYVRLTEIPAMSTVHVAAPVPVVTAPGSIGGYIGEGGGDGGGGGDRGYTGDTKADVNVIMPTMSRIPINAVTADKTMPTTTPAVCAGDHAAAFRETATPPITGFPEASLPVVADRALCRSSQLDICTPFKNSSYAREGAIAKARSFCLQERFVSQMR